MLQIPGYPKYAADKAGNIWRVGAPRGKPLKPSLVKGYPRVMLCQNDIKTNHFVHLLVLLTYVGPKPPGREALHRNGIKTDNQLDNLCWGTRAENIADKFRHGKQPFGEKAYQAKLTEDAVREIRAAFSYQLDEMAQKYGVSRSAIEAARYGRNWKHVIR
jgi:HNH endonuclease